MDDPCMAWPFWKFGMKRDDLSTKLHDQYNTIPSSIQDPDAFHHDVFEVSRLADTADEFHRLMADRKEQRLKELNASLDLAAVEIIANPKLVGTAQWSYALQLFRTRSLDSLVRLFSSYLPDDYCSRQGYYTASSNGSSYSDRCSVRTASTNLSSLDDVDGPTFFHDDDDEKPIMTHEPLHISTSLSSAVVTDLPPSPRSMTTHSETSVSSPIDTDNDDYVLRNLTPARTLSFSGSESGRFAGRVLQSLDDEEEYTSQSEDPDSLTTSLSDLENRSTRESSVEEEQHPDYTQYPESAIVDEYDYEDDFPTTQLPFDLSDDDVMESSETPTPKPGITISTAAASSYLDSKPYSSLRSIPATSFRSSSPKIPHLRRRDASPAKTSTSSSSSMMSSRRSPEEALSRIQKPQPDAMRGARALAAKGRRRGLD